MIVILFFAVSCAGFAQEEVDFREILENMSSSFDIDNHQKQVNFTDKLKKELPNHAIVSPLNHFTNNSWTGSYGFFNLNDTYLSPLKYFGWNVQLDAVHQKFFKKKYNLFWKNHNTFNYAYLINKPATAAIMYVSGDVGFGVNYIFYEKKNFAFYVGGCASLFAAGKYSGRNVNNIASIDANFLISSDFGAWYKVKLGKKANLVLRDEFKIPLIGTMFVPEMGTLYYEYTFGNFNNAFHFTSFHNRFGIKNNFYLDFEFNKIILRLTCLQNYQKWHANYLSFKTFQYNFGAGFVVNLQNVTFLEK